MLVIAQAHASTIGYLVTAAACLIFSYSSFTSHSLRQGQEVFPFFRLPILVPGPTQPPIQWVSGFFPAGNAAGRDVDQSPPSSAEFKNEWNYNAAHLICFMVWTRSISPLPLPFYHTGYTV
jgi:hypothetical protein